jgi:hypothetical protein
MARQNQKTDSHPPADDEACRAITIISCSLTSSPRSSIEPLFAYRIVIPKSRLVRNTTALFLRLPWLRATKLAKGQKTLTGRSRRILVWMQYMEPSEGEEPRTCNRFPAAATARDEDDGMNDPNIVTIVT